MIIPLWKKLKEIDNAREEKLITISNQFGNPNQLSKYYIEPNCQHVNPADENEDDPVSTVRSPIFKTLNSFFNKDFAISDDGRNQMFILGDAGMGKSSLLVMLRLTYLQSFWPKGYNCELLKLGQNSIKEISLISDPRKTILLLDALDEDKLAWKRLKERLLELLDATKNFKRVIITCRTQFFPKDQIDPFNRIGRIKIGGYISPLIFISFFDDEQVESYLHKRFPYDQTKIDSAKSIISNMGSLRLRPLLLAYIDGFLEIELKDIDELTIYKALIETWLAREERKIIADGRRSSADDLLKACCMCAAIMQTNESKELSPDLIKNKISTHKELRLVDLLDIGGRSLLNVNSDGNYRFSHYTIQEYLLAHGILNNYFDKQLLGKKKLIITEKIYYFLEYTPIESREISNLIFVYVNPDCKFLTSKKFVNCEFRTIGFSNSKLTNSYFENCVFFSFKSNKMMVCDTTFNKCNFSDGSSRFEDSIFERTDFSNCNFSNTTLIRCSFGKCQIINCDLRNCNRVSTINF